MKKPPQKSGELFEKLTAIVARLRDPNGGCPWDLEQTHSSLKQYLIEESYEVLESIDSHPEKLAEELGDVLLQVMLHSQIGADSGSFNIDDVIQHIADKLVVRHPHVFGETKVKDSTQVLKNWEAIKKQGLAPGASMLDGVPKALPALLRAHRIGTKVGRVGFDWDSADDIRDKIREELEEFLSAGETDRAALEEEFGDLLFTLAQLARKLNLDAEGALTSANNKFIRRFKALEKLADADLQALGRAKLEELWQRVKANA